MCWFPAVAAAQTATIIPLASEPHHHLVLHNQYINLYQVEVALHDSVALHRHDFDAISIMMSDSQVTVSTPGKPGAQFQLVNGQIRLQPLAYVHSTVIDGGAPYRNVTVELLLAQEGAHNRCSAVIPTLPVDCSSKQDSASAEGVIEQPQFETDQTVVSLTRLLPGHEITLGDSGHAELIVVMDEGVDVTGDASGTHHLLHPGHFVWRDHDKPPLLFKNDGTKDARLISFKFKPAESPKKSKP
jgi:hypothetical protein